jgi:putative membrane protein
MLWIPGSSNKAMDGNASLSTFSRRGATTMWSKFVVDLLSFLTYFVSGAIATGLYTVIYTAITPHKEFELIKAQNQAAAVALAGSLLGFMIALTRLIEQAVALGAFALWALVAIVVQLLAYGLVRLTFPQLSERIANGELPAATWLAGASITAGLLNAACLSS